MQNPSGVSFEDPRDADLAALLPPPVLALLAKLHRSVLAQAGVDPRQGREVVVEQVTNEGNNAETA